MVYQNRPLQDGSIVRCERGMALAADLFKVAAENHGVEFGAHGGAFIFCLGLCVRDGCGCFIRYS